MTPIERLNRFLKKSDGPVILEFQSSYRTLQDLAKARRVQGEAIFLRPQVLPLATVLTDDGNYEQKFAEGTSLNTCGGLDFSRAEGRKFNAPPFFPLGIAKAAFMLQKLGCDHIKSDQFTFSFKSYGQPVTVWTAAWQLADKGIVDYEVEGIWHQKLQNWPLYALENLALADEYLLSLALREGTATARPNQNAGQEEKSFCLESLALPAGELSRMGITLPPEVVSHPNCLFPMRMGVFYYPELRQKILSSTKPMVVSF